jgi:thymidylate synthase (FAD)
MSETHYLSLTSELNVKAEEARSVLTNDCKTELVMTGFISDWEHFFDLRSKGTTGKPHPDIKILADTLYLEFINKGYLK